MTKQEAFNTICDTLAAQGFERSVNDAQTCMYRGPNGKRCPAGALIPDELYDPKFEEYSWRLVASRLGITDKGLIGFVDDCQEAHDRAASPTNLRIWLTNIGHRINLDLPVSLETDK